MRLLALSLSAMLLACLAASPSNANPWSVYPPIAPDACGPGFYSSHPCGMAYGPNHYLRPCWEPFNGFVPGFGQPGQPGGLPALPSPGVAGPDPGLPPSPTFPSHPYARSPRDFFMLD
jgi:hypothetical protein